MKIGIVTQAYYPVLGGVTEHVWHLGHELQRRGHEVTVITGGLPRQRNGDNPDGADRGLRVLRHGFQIPMMGYGANVHITWGWKLGRTLQKIEDQEKFDIVHVHSPTDPGLPIIASKSMRTLKVGTHHSYRDDPRAADLAWKVFRGVFDDAVKKIACHIAVSNSAAAVAHRYYPELPITIIPNGVDTTRFSPNVEAMPVRVDDEFVILYVGRMDPRKGAKFLFATLPILEKAIPKYKIVVVGTGWMKNYYDAHIPLNLRHRVQFTGYAKPEEVPRYYRAADVYCSPATGNESFGIVLLEAMACGTPVVASDIDGYRWVIEPGQEGLLVPPRSPEHLARALIDLYNDPEKRKRMGERGIVKAEKYAWPRVVNQIEEVYQEVLNRR